jgi:hypothetical protein
MRTLFPSSALLRRVILRQLLLSRMNGQLLREMRESVLKKLVSFLSSILSSCQEKLRPVAFQYLVLALHLLIEINMILLK